MTETTRVQKTVLTVTVFSQYDIGHMSLTDIAWQADEGDMVAGFVIDHTESVKGDALREGLVAIGNDGSFFDAGADDD